MGKLSERMNYAEIERMELKIAESSLLNHSLSDPIMNKIGEEEMSRIKRTQEKHGGRGKKVAVAAAIAAVLGGGVVGSGFVSPAMAGALSKIPGFGVIYNGTQEAAVEAARTSGLLQEPGLRVTHDDITLELDSVVYDGTRLSVVLEREGAELDNVALPVKYWDSSAQPKGYIVDIANEGVVMLADGQPISMDHGHFGDVPYGQDKRFMVDLKQPDLPDQFELTVRVKLTQVAETYEFKVPVQTNDQTLVMKPDITRTDGEFSYTVKELYVSPLTNRIVIDSQGAVPQSADQSGPYSASKVYYELIDDQGNEVQQHVTAFYNERPGTEDHTDELYAPFANTPKSITVKPYTYTVKTDDWSIAGMKVDEKGNQLPGKENGGTRTYLKDLEVTIPIQ